jgi:hypothetical protein
VQHRLQLEPRNAVLFSLAAGRLMTAALADVNHFLALVSYQKSAFFEMVAELY